MAIDLKKEFQYIRETFFPRWDRKREWKIKRVWHLPCGGKYDDHSKRILIRNPLADQDDFHRLLIHEICHCASFHHGRRFQNRLSKAKDEAEKIGRKELAQKIEEELISFKTTSELPGYLPRYIYQQIYDIVFVDRPKISWAQLLRYVARENGSYPKEFLKRYKRAKEIYLGAKKDARDEEKSRKKFEQLLKGGEPSTLNRPMAGRTRVRKKEVNHGIWKTISRL